MGARAVVWSRSSCCRCSRDLQWPPVFTSAARSASAAFVGSDALGALATSIDMDSGLYILLLTLSRPAIITLRSSRTRLVPGTYAYVGSARRALRARVDRHLRRAKPKCWHIDLLTCRRDVRVIAILLPGIARTECELNRHVAEVVAGEAPIRGFGSSDCGAGCPAHLWRCNALPTAAELGRSSSVRFEIVDTSTDVVEDVGGDAAFKDGRGE